MWSRYRTAGEGRSKKTLMSSITRGRRVRMTQVSAGDDHAIQRSSTGTAISAPTMPRVTLPTAMTTMIASGCSSLLCP